MSAVMSAAPGVINHWAALIPLWRGKPIPQPTSQLGVVRNLLFVN